MPRYYGPGRSTTEENALRQIELDEKGKEPRPRTQVWRAPEGKKESFMNYLKQKKEESDER